MKLEDLMADLTVTHARRAYWKIPTDHVELPPVIEGGRGPWSVLVAFDGKQVIRRSFPLLTDPNDDWEPYTPETVSEVQK